MIPVETRLNRVTHTFSKRMESAQASRARSEEVWEVVTVPFLLREERTGGRRPSLHDHYSACIFLAIAVTSLRGENRIDCASSQFLNPEITTGFPATIAR